MIGCPEMTWEIELSLVSTMLAAAWTSNRLRQSAYLQGDVLGDVLRHLEHDASLHVLLEAFGLHLQRYGPIGRSGNV